MIVKPCGTRKFGVFPCNSRDENSVLRLSLNRTNGKDSRVRLRTNLSITLVRFRHNRVVIAVSNFLDICTCALLQLCRSCIDFNPEFLPKLTIYLYFKFAFCDSRCFCLISVFFQIVLEYKCYFLALQVGRYIVNMQSSSCSCFVFDLVSVPTDWQHWALGVPIPGQDSRLHQVWEIGIFCCRAWSSWTRLRHKKWCHHRSFATRRRTDTYTQHQEGNSKHPAGKDHQGK